MYSIRKWIFRPKRSDQSVLAGFFYADEELNMVATELDSFDGRKDPERCTTLVNQLRMCQDKVLSYIERIMDDCVPLERASRDFRVKFPDDVLQESLSGQLWFGAECLAAGSSIMNREVESASMRPLAKALTRHLDYLRALLRDQCLRNINTYTDRIKESLILFDRLFAEFEISYVSAMVPVKTMKEYDVMQEVIVLFSETTQRALRLNLLTQDMIDDYDPALMFTIPRLAIISGLLVYPEGPLNPDMDPVNMSEMFRPFQTLLYKIRELLWTLSKEELWLLEKSLCSAEEQGLYRDLTNIAFPDDLDPYQDLSVEHLSELTLDGAMGLDLETDAGMMVGGLLSVDPKYGCMSQSPSTMTLVANPDYEAFPDEVVDGDVDESCQRVHLAKDKEIMKHQDSADSGMLSENGSVLGVGSGGYERVSGSSNESTHGCSINQSRALQHSVSWPEATLRPHRRTRYHDAERSPLGFLEDSGEQEGVQQPYVHSHEFNFHLPLNTTETTTNSSSNHVWERTPTNAVDLGSTRVFYTTDCCDEDHCFSSNNQISYVTETLNEVFVTDTSTFQQSFISAVTSKALTESMGICCKCGNKTCGTHSHDQGTGNSNNAEQSVEDQMNMSNTEQDTGDHDTTEIKGGSTTTSDDITIAGSCSHGNRYERKARDQDDCCQSESCGTAGSDTQHTGDVDHVMTPSGEENVDTVEGDRGIVASHEDQSVLPLAMSEQCEHLCFEALEWPTTTETTERVAVMATLLASQSSSEEEKANDELLEKHVGSGSLKGPTKPCRRCQSSSMVVDGCDNCNTTNSDSAGGSLRWHLGIISPTQEAENSEVESRHTALYAKGEQMLRSSLEVPRIQRLRYADGPTMMCSSCNRSRRSSVGSTDVDWDRESYNSSETSSYNSDCHDDEEIALAIQAAELASRREARSRFKSSHDLIHRLFVCISGVADQLQTNYASDLRHILKAVFECNSSEPFLSLELQAESSDDSENLTGDYSVSRDRHSQDQSNGEQLSGDEFPREQVSGDMESDNISEAPHCEDRSLRYGDNEPTTSDEVDPPKWVPDDESPHCESCEALFTFMRRRHHCRNCGKIFCGRCSSNAVPLPHYGHTKPVRVCNHCFMFQVNPFMVDE